MKCERGERGERGERERGEGKRRGEERRGEARRGEERFAGVNERRAQSGYGFLTPIGGPSRGIFVWHFQKIELCVRH